MKRKIQIVIMAVLIAGLVGGGYVLASGGAAENPAQETTMIPGSFSTLARTARSGVVNIRTVKTLKDGGPVFRHFFGNPFGRQRPHGNFFNPFQEGAPHREYKQRSLGSGFIIDRDGYIVTNNHVIENADRITVKLADGTDMEASVVGRDPNTDLALIKIDASGSYEPLKMGDSDGVEIGSWVVAVGSPFGLEQTVTAGIVSAKGRVIGAGPYDDFIQTDASINPGNSGGPLLNLNGDVVGINTAIIASGQGIGFAIPVNLAKGIVQQLKESGEVTRGWLGVGIQNLSPELAGYYDLDADSGALVTQVYPGDPADLGGIRPGDVIVGINGKTIESSRDLSSVIAGLPVGRDAAVDILRNGRQKTIQVRLTKREDAEWHARVEKKTSEGLGINLSEMTPEKARRFGYDADEKGILVTDVEPGGTADRAGLRTGDLIKEVNHRQVATTAEFHELTGKQKTDGTLQLLIRRGKSGFFAVKIEPEEKKG